MGFSSRAVDGAAEVNRSLDSAALSAHRRLFEISRPRKGLAECALAARTGICAERKCAQSMATSDNR